MDKTTWFWWVAAALSLLGVLTTGNDISMALFWGAGLYCVNNALPWPEGVTLIRNAFNYPENPDEEKGV